MTPRYCSKCARLLDDTGPILTYDESYRFDPESGRPLSGKHGRKCPQEGHDEWRLLERGVWATRVPVP